MNRGRIQAQGGGIEKSEPWVQKEDIDKKDGLNKVKSLEKKLSRKEILKWQQFMQ